MYRATSYRPGDSSGHRSKSLAVIALLAALVVGQNKPCGAVERATIPVSGDTIIQVLQLDKASIVLDRSNSSVSFAGKKPKTFEIPRHKVYVDGEFLLLGSFGIHDIRSQAVNCEIKGGTMHVTILFEDKGREVDGTGVFPAMNRRSAFDRATGEAFMPRPLSSHRSVVVMKGRHQPLAR